MLYADGSIKLTNPLVSDPANAYTVLEKRELARVVLVSGGIRDHFSTEAVSNWSVRS